MCASTSAFSVVGCVASFRCLRYSVAYRRHSQYSWSLLRAPMAGRVYLWRDLLSVFCLRHRAYHAHRQYQRRLKQQRKNILYHRSNEKDFNSLILKFTLLQAAICHANANGEVAVRSTAGSSVDQDWTLSLYTAELPLKGAN